MRILLHQNQWTTVPSSIFIFIWSHHLLHFIYEHQPYKTNIWLTKPWLVLLTFVSFSYICLYFLHLSVFLTHICLSFSILSQHSDINIFAMDQLQCEIPIFFWFSVFFSRQFIERKFVHFFSFYFVCNMQARLK